MKFENASIKNLESVEEYVEKLMLSGKIFQREYVEEHIFIGLQRSGQEEIERQKYLYRKHGVWQKKIQIRKAL